MVIAGATVVASPDNSTTSSEAGFTGRRPVPRVLQYHYAAKKGRREFNLAAAKAVAAAISRSLGPKGIGITIQDGRGEVTITNDGATILKKMSVIHPAARMMVELSKAQDIKAGDGTTSVVVLAGSLLEAAEKLLAKGLHPTEIADGFRSAGDKCAELLMNEIAIPLYITDKAVVTKCAATSLNSKVISQQARVLAPMAVDADIKVRTVLDGTVEDSELIDGLLLQQSVSCGPKKVKKAKIGLIQFCISPPKTDTDMDLNVGLSDKTHIDRILREERSQILEIVKKIEAAGCNVLLIQKSILHDALNDLATHPLEKCKIMTVRDIEREDIEFISKTLGCRPIANLDHFTAENLCMAENVEEIQASGSKLVKVTGITKPGRTVSILVRGSNQVLLNEAERALHDALCVVRCLIRERTVLPGGGAPEVELSVRLNQIATTLAGSDASFYTAFAQALEVIPLTLAKNAGMSANNIVTELRKLHSDGNKKAGFSVKKGAIVNVLVENVIQPLLVTLSMISLATETVASILQQD